jgi:hypothetical protein
MHATLLKVVKRGPYTEEDFPSPHWIDADEGEYLSKFFPNRLVRKDIQDCKHYSDRAAKILHIFCERLKPLWNGGLTKDHIRKPGRRRKK